MRRALAVVQLLGMATALVAMLAPAPRTLVESWVSFTIYPWSVLVLLAVGAGAATLSIVAPAGTTTALAAAAGVTGVCAAQVGALGVWAHQHWLPAFGFGGNYAGGVDELERLAWVVAVAGVLASLAAIGQLALQRDWPGPVVAKVRWRRVGFGVAILFGLPLLLSAMDPFSRDLTSLVALTLIYGIPWGVSLVAGGWLTREGVLGVLATSVVSAAVSAIAPSKQITSGGENVIFAGAALLLAVLLAVELKEDRERVHGRPGEPRM